MTILSFSKIWVLIVAVGAFIGTTILGFVLVMATSLFPVFADGDGVTQAPTGAATQEVTGTPMTGTATATVTVTPASSPPATATPAATPIIIIGPPGDANRGHGNDPDRCDEDNPGNGARCRNQVPGPIQFEPVLEPIYLCRGAYIVRRTLVNQGGSPLEDGYLRWTVIQGADLVREIRISSTSFVPVAYSTPEPGESTELDAAVTITSTGLITGVARLISIQIEQEINLDIEVEVSDLWWEQPDGAEIRLWLGLGREFYRDANRGHGNDPDRCDEDNPGNGRRCDDQLWGSPGQIITIVKQGSNWVILDGLVQPFEEGKLLIDGTVVTLTECSKLPPSFIPGSRVRLIGFIQPDGALVVINLILVDINIVNPDPDVNVTNPPADNNGDGGRGRGRGRSGDHDRGHGNDPDRFDEDNPGKSKRK